MKLRSVAKRRQEIEQLLEAGLAYGFDHQDATDDGPEPRDVSVMVGFRDTEQRMVIAEFTLPADRWPGLMVFAAQWREASERAPS